MFFRRRRREPDDPHAEAWRRLAEALELTRLDDAAEEELRAELAVDTGRVDRLHALRRDGQPELLVFEHVRPHPGRRRGEERRARVLLRADAPLCEAGWRAFPTGHPLLASLQASRSGGRLVTTGDAAFDEAVGVVARDPEPAAALLTGPVRAALLRLLADDLPEATVTCGGRHLAWRAHAELDPPCDRLDRVATRLLGAWAALAAARRAPPS
jgi:hypothetical protein